jgi:hypothetical protein
MAGCGGLLGFLGRARKERKGSFIAAQRRFHLTVVAYRKPSMGAEQRGRAAGLSANGHRRFARWRVCIGRVAPA